ncbi:MAG TPA: hypothetical protein VG097_14230 [Gemmata sp.]|jgi:hypothetical protein|nr:hypothetical protein [Gemmata sp.]
MDLGAVVFVVIVIIGVIARVCKEQEEKKFRESNPEAWVRLKELEHEKEKMKHERTKFCANIGTAIARFFFGK